MKKSTVLIGMMILQVIVACGQSKKYIKLGDELMSVDRHKQALVMYKKAEPLDKDNPHLLHQIARCYAKQSNAKETMKYMQTALEIKKDTTLDMYYTLARAYHLDHQFDKAIGFYKKYDPYRKNIKTSTKRIRECQYGKKYLAAKKNVKITNLGKRINTAYDDMLPKITADMFVLIVTSNRKGAIGNGENMEDVYMAVNKGGAWTNASNVGPPISSENNDACVGLSNDGQTMFMFKGSNSGDIYMSELKGDKWSKPTPLPFNTEYRETSACLSPDGRTLYFVKKVNDGQSKIYKVGRTSSGKWSKPIALSGTINGRYDVESPYMHPDGKTLYFSSKGHSSMGGYDIFKSVKTGNGWSKPINLGYPINTAGDEWGFVLSASGQFGYYASDKEGGFGKMDVYSIRMPLPKRKPSLALLKGNVKEEFTDKPIEADIIITDNEKNEVVAKLKSNGTTGDYLVSLPSGKNYGITIEKEGHLFHSENVYLSPNKGFKELKKDVKLMNVKSGSKVVLKNIFFASSKYELEPTSFAELDRIADLLKKQSQLKIEISGHTDNTGSADLNLTLSKNRAEAVINYLVGKGISRTRLIAKGYGSTKPIKSNDTASGRRENRRTEFKIL